MIKIKFIKSPIGAFGLAYAEGMEAELNENQAQILIEAEYAVKIEEKEVPEKQVKENRKK